MSRVLIFTLVLFIQLSGAQTDVEKHNKIALKTSNNLINDANTLVEDSDYALAEMTYRKAISEYPTTVAGTYNLGRAHYTAGHLKEALFRHQQAVKTATNKADKHKAYHNIGNILMKVKDCKNAVEAFKNALRNNPTDDETRYNLALAKDCAEQQGGGDDGQDDNKEEENKDQEKNEDQKGDNKDNQQNEDQQEGNEKEKDGDQEQDDNGKPKEDQQGQGDKNDTKEKQQQTQPVPGQLSPQEIKNILEAMNNQEQKVQEKMNAQKIKGVKIPTDKDW